MKTIRFLSAALFVLLCGISVFAQEPAKAEAVEIKAENKSDYYYVTLPIETVYPHRLGYLIVYRKAVGIGQAYLPIKWFGSTAGKAELIRMGGGNSWPYLSIYYKEGKVDHLRLYVRKEFGHPSWGSVPSTANIDDRFNVEELVLEE